MAKLSAEFIGRARALRRRIEEIDGHVANAIGASIKPLLNRAMPRVKGAGCWFRKEQVAGAVRLWRVGMPAFGRVSLVITDRHATRHATITECRIITSARRDPRWTNEGWENGVVLVQLTVEIEPRDIRFHQRFLCSVSQHALARRFERGRDRSDDAVMADLAALEAYRADAITTPPPFALPVASGSGWWSGERFALEGNGGAMTLAVRTFLDRDAIPDDRVARLMETAPA